MHRNLNDIKPNETVERTNCVVDLAKKDNGQKDIVTFRLTNLLPSLAVLLTFELRCYSSWEGITKPTITR